MPEDKPHDDPPLSPSRKVADAGLLFRDTSQPRPSSPPPQAAPTLRRIRVKCSPWSTFPNGQPTGRPRSSLLRRVHAPRPRRPASLAPSAKPEPPRDDSRLDPSDLVEADLVEVGRMGTESDRRRRLDGGPSAPGLFRLRPGILRAGVRSPHRRVAGGRRAQLSDVDHARAPGSGHTRAGSARLLQRVYRTMSHTSAGCGCCSARRGGFRRRSGRSRDSRDTGRSSWAGCDDGHAGPLTPLVFEVVNFKSEKSAGKVRIDAYLHASMSRFAASAPPGRSTRFRRRSAWSAGPTICGISKTERCRAAQPGTKSIARA